MKVLACLLLYSIVGVITVNGQIKNLNLTVPLCQANPSATPGPQDPPLPVLAPQFSVHIDASIIEKSMTLSADEFVDTFSGMSSLTISMNGQIEQMIYNNNTGEMYDIQNGMCTVAKVTNNFNNLAFGGYIGSSIPHAFSTQNLLDFGKKFGEVYVGRGFVRGMLCDRWTACMYWPSPLPYNFTLDYYFTVQNWTVPYGLHSPMPVRAEVKGYSSIFGPGNSTFWHVYDFTGYQPYVEDYTKLHTPPGIACYNRKATRTVPKLKSAYQYREEITNVPGMNVISVDVYYNYVSKLLRIDQRDPNTKQAMTDIHDYNTGIAYNIDRQTMKCTIKPITETSFDATQNKSVLHMRTPSQLFYVDTTYAYSGKRTIRGIQCDVYSKVRTDIPIAPNQNVSVEVYYMSKRWSSSSDLGSTGNNPDVPVRVIMNAPLLNREFYYDIFDFDQDSPDLTNTFDITPCFTDMETINFQITFPGDASDFNVQNEKTVRNAILSAIISATSLSPIRIQHSAIHWDEGNTYFVGAITDRPPSMARFQPWAGKMGTDPKAMVLPDATDPYSCASACYSQTSSTCNSFDFCTNSNLCVLSTTFSTAPTSMATNGSCVHYTRTVNSSAQQDLTSDSAFIILRDAVYQGGVNAFVPLPGQSVKTVGKSYTGKWISNNVYRNPSKGSVSTASVMTQFTSQSGKAIRGYNDVRLSGLAVDGCASQCVSELSFTCQSFEYCFSTASCVLSRIHPDERPDLIVSNVSCSLYTRDYTAKFTKFAGTTVLSQSNTIYQNINSANQCAKLCVNYNSFSCKSFDYCPYINTCFLGKTHIFSAPKANIKQTPQCAHYSRNYAADFKVTANKQIQLKDNRIVEGVTVQQCAKLCVDEETFSCASFDYCGNFTECRLSTASMTDVGQITLQATAYCSVYNRQYYPNGKPFIPHVDTSAKYTSGAMGGLAIAMLIIGLVAGIAIIVGWTKYHGHHHDEMAVSFSKKDTLSVEDN